MSDITDFIILSLLSNRDYYAYELINDIAVHSGGCILINANTVYTALYRLEENGYIREYSVLVGRKRTRIYYSIENSGMDHLFELYNDYKKTVTGVTNIIENLKIIEGSNNNE